MKIYTKQYNVALGQMVTIEEEVAINIKSGVETYADLPSNDADNTARYLFENGHLCVKRGAEWIDQGVFDLGLLLAERTMQELS